MEFDRFQKLKSCSSNIQINKIRTYKATMINRPPDSADTYMIYRNVKTQHQKMKKSQIFDP